MNIPTVFLGASGVSFIFYSLYLFVLRVYLSPLRQIPGPKLAIWSFWYEFYYDVVLQGRYTWKIAELHKQYGPIIRINPYEVHISDPDFYDEVYVRGAKRKTEQWSWTVSPLTYLCCSSVVTQSLSLRDKLQTHEDLRLAYETCRLF
ncbi:MAG: hypothetical protein Q9208_002411 [Pyrenodesmia sp. 3 TL-2023]